MPLVELNLFETKVIDLTPLARSATQSLWLNGGAGRGHLAPRGRAARESHSPQDPSRRPQPTRRRAAPAPSHRGDAGEGSHADSGPAANAARLHCGVDRDRHGAHPARCPRCARSGHRSIRCCPPAGVLGAAVDGSVSGPCLSGALVASDSANLAELRVQALSAYPLHSHGDIGHHRPRGSRIAVSGRRGAAAG